MHRTGLTLVSAMNYHLPETPSILLDSPSKFSHPPPIPLISTSFSSIFPHHKPNTSETEPLPFPMALTRLALKNLQQRALLVSSPADALLHRQTEALLHRQTEALIRRFSAMDVSDQSSEGKECKNSKIIPKNRGRKWLWRNNGGEFHLGNSLIQAAENINRVLKSLNLSRPWWVSGSRVKEQEECYKLRLEMPGIAKEDVKVTVEGRILSIRGEHREEEKGEESGWTGASYGYYDTAVMLPEDAVADEIKAELKDGVLMITVPRTEKPPKDVKEVTVL